MKRKTIDTMREMRLWTGNIVVPVILIGVTLYLDPDVRYGIKKEINRVKCKLYNKKHGIKDLG